MDGYIDIYIYLSRKRERERERERGERERERERERQRERKNHKLVLVRWQILTMSVRATQSTCRSWSCGGHVVIASRHVSKVVSKNISTGNRGLMSDCDTSDAKCSVKDSGALKTK